MLVYEHILREEQDTTLGFKIGVHFACRTYFLLSLEASMQHARQDEL